MKSIMSLIVLLAFLLSAVAGAAQAEKLCGTTESLVSWVSKDPQASAQGIIQRLINNPASLRVLWRPKGSRNWTGQTAKWKLDAKKGVLIATIKGDELFSVSVSASDYEGAVRLTVSAITRETKAGPQELMVAAPFNPGNWQRQIHPQVPMEVLKPDKQKTIDFLGAGKACFPFGVLEKKEGFLLWGAMDIGKYRSLTPNMIPNSIPSFTYKPLSLEKGKTFTFDITLKWLPKPEFKYRDVLRWYLCSLENSDPLTKDWVGKWDGKPYARPFAEGNLGTGGTPGQLYDGDMHSKDAIYKDSHKNPSEKSLRTLKIGSIWFMFFRPTDAPSPTEKTWENMWGVPATREDMLAQIRWFQARGVRPLLYQNQFLTHKGSKDDEKSPLYKWIARDKNGKPYPLYAFHGSVGPIKTRMYYFADFGNDEYREWNIKTLKECVDSYKLDGLAWDMGFPQSPLAGYSHSNPNTTIGHGILRVQAEAWKWIHEKYPNMRVIVNESPGAFSQRVSDAVILENTYGGGKKKLDFEAAKAMGTTIIVGEYPREPDHLFQGIPVATYGYLVMRYRAEGLNTKSQDAVVTAGLPWEPGAGAAIIGSDLQVDGKWHTVVVDLKKKVPDLNEVKSLAVMVSSAEVKEASLDIEFLRFAGEPAGSKSRDMRDKTNSLPYHNFFPVELDSKHFDFWTPVPASDILPPGAAASDFGLQIKDGTTRFSVKGGGRKMKWVTLPPKFTGNMMRVMSYGSCLSFGALSKYWPEMNEFSAKAMATPLLVGSHDVKVESKPANPDDEVTASAWAGGGRLLLAVYNDREDQALSTIIVAPEVMQTAGVRKIKSSTVRILGRNGCLLKNRSADVRLTKEGGLQVKVKLKSGRVLLLRVNDNDDSGKTKDG